MWVLQEHTVGVRMRITIMIRVTVGVSVRVRMMLKDRGSAWFIWLVVWCKWWVYS